MSSTGRHSGSALATSRSASSQGFPLAVLHGQTAGESSRNLLSLPNVGARQERRRIGGTKPPFAEVLLTRQAGYNALQGRQHATADSEAEGS